MEHTRLRSSGLQVSRIALGCMSFGDTSRGFNEWALDDVGAEPIFRRALELGSPSGRGGRRWFLGWGCRSTGGRWPCL